MCGRYGLDVTFQQLRDLYNVAGEPPNFDARFNAAPTDKMPVVRRDPETGQRRLDVMRWGLLPAWAKSLSEGARCINAMTETVAAKPTFRAAFKARRCLVPATAFYEWQKLPDGKKQPFAFGRVDGQPLTFAGLWESWTDKASGERVLTYAILTGGPNPVTAPVHDRMPIILDAADWPGWLGEDGAPAEAAEAMRERLETSPFAAARMKAWKVGAAVGNVRNQGPELLHPVEL